MKTCGTCLNYRTEEEVSPISGATIVHDFCAHDPNRLCGYCVLACENYDPDVDYIKFMEFDKETSND
jgi:hypothetical protein